MISTSEQVYLKKLLLKFALLLPSLRLRGSLDNFLVIGKMTNCNIKMTPLGCRRPVVLMLFSCSGFFSVTILLLRCSSSVPSSLDWLFSAVCTLFFSSCVSFFDSKFIQDEREDEETRVMLFLSIFIFPFEETQEKGSKLLFTKMTSQPFPSSTLILPSHSVLTLTCWVKSFEIQCNFISVV